MKVLISFKHSCMAWYIQRLDELWSTSLLISSKMVWNWLHSWLVIHVIVKFWYSRLWMLHMYMYVFLASYQHCKLLGDKTYFWNRYKYVQWSSLGQNPFQLHSWSYTRGAFHEASYQWLSLTNLLSANQVQGFQ